VDDATDCDDTDAGVNPGAEEVCNTGVDEDCDADPEECRLEGVLSTALASTSWTYDGDDVVEIFGLGDVAGGTGAEVAIATSDAIHLIEDPPAGTWVLGSTDFVRLNSPSDSAWTSAVVATGSLGETLVVANARGDADDVYVVSAFSSGEIQVDVRFPHTTLPGVLGVEPSLAAGNNQVWIGSGGTVHLLDLVSSVAEPVLTEVVVGGDETGLGESVTFGDLDADGVGDLVVSAPGANADQGEVFVFYGMAGNVATVDADAAISGRTGNRMGDVLATIDGCDFNGDGYQDLLLGAPAATGRETDSGAAFLYSGPVVGTLGVLDAYLMVDGTYAGGRLGSSLSGSGDLDADGRSDVLIGGGGSDGTDARTYLLYGDNRGGRGETELTNAIYAGGDAYSPGPTSTHVGDVNDDGADDFLVLGADSALTRSTVWLFGGAGE
jgi:hypothetical protein